MRNRGLWLGLLGVFACGEDPYAGAEQDDLVDVGDAGSTRVANLAKAVPSWDFEASSTTCRDGRRPVEQRVKVLNEDGSYECAFALPSIVCLVGFCGDGRCEPEEAVACGCSLDCAIED